MNFEKIDLEQAVLLSNYQMIPIGELKNGAYFSIPEQYENLGDRKIEGTIKCWLHIFRM